MKPQTRAKLLAQIRMSVKWQALGRKQVLTGWCGTSSQPGVQVGLWGCPEGLAEAAAAPATGKGSREVTKFPTMLEQG